MANAYTYIKKTEKMPVCFKDKSLIKIAMKKRHSSGVWFSPYHCLILLTLTFHLVTSCREAMITSHQNRIEQLRESFKEKLAEADNWQDKVGMLPIKISMCCSYNIFVFQTCICFKFVILLRWL